MIITSKIQLTINGKFMQRVPEGEFEGKKINERKTERKTENKNLRQKERKTE